jgi:hypothetical protein
LSLQCPTDQNGQEKSDNRNKNDKVEQLFISLAGIYGYLWSRMHSTEAEWAAARTQWRKGIENLSNEQINHALSICRTLRNENGNAKLINLPEFIGFAESLKKKQVFSIAPPSAPKNFDIGKRVTDECRKTLGRQPKYAA